MKMRWTGVLALAAAAVAVAGGQSAKPATSNLKAEPRSTRADPVARHAAVGAPAAGQAGMQDLNRIERNVQHIHPAQKKAPANTAAAGGDAAPAATRQNPGINFNYHPPSGGGKAPKGAARQPDRKPH